MAEQETSPLTGTRKPRFFYGYLVVAASFSILLLMFGTFYTFGVFFKPVLTEFGWTRAATAGAFSLYSLLHGALYIVTGKLNDRFGPRLLIAGCGFLLGLGYLLMSQVSAIWQLYLFYGVIVALGMSGGFVPVLSTVAKWFVKRRGLISGIVVSGIGFGEIIMPPLASRLIIAYDWRVAYIVVGIITLVLTISAAQFMRRDPAQMKQSPYGADEAKAEGFALAAKGVLFREAIHTRQFWQFGTIMICCFFNVGVIMVHIVAHATELGMSVTGAANLLAVVGGLSIAGRITLGSAVDRIGSKMVLVIITILMSVSLFALAGAKEEWMLYLCSAVFGFAYGGVTALVSPMVAELFGLISHGTIFGVAAFCTTIGTATGSVVAGGIFDIMGSYSLAFLVCAIISVIGLILVSLLKPTGRGGETNDSGRST